MENPGGFSALFDIKKLNLKDPILLSSTDGVGTKLLLAVEYSFYKNIGIDLVAMCVNDVLVNGGKPIFFLDYISTSKLLKNQFLELIKSIHKGCKESQCSLIGGETAEMPGVYKKNDFDMAGFAVGVVERKNLVTKINVSDDSIMLGLESSGFHSNGFSLIRNVLEKNIGNLNIETPYKSKQKKLFEDLLIPTKIYTRLILPLIEKNLIDSMAHITGGGLSENIERALPDGFHVKIDAKNFFSPEKFIWLAKIGKIRSDEMLKTFNCGIGFVIVIKKKNYKQITKYFKLHNTRCVELGIVQKGKRKNKVQFKKFRPWV